MPKARFTLNALQCTEEEFYGLAGLTVLCYTVGWTESSIELKVSQRGRQPNREVQNFARGGATKLFLETQVSEGSD